MYTFKGAGSAQEDNLSPTTKKLVGASVMNEEGEKKNENPEREGVL